MQRTWSNGFARSLTADTDTKTISYEDNRRGCEAGGDQTFAEFCEKGPLVGFDALGRDLALELLDFLGVETAGGWDPQRTVAVRVGQAEVVFYDDPWLEVHGSLLGSTIEAFTMGRAAFYEMRGIKSGILAQPATLDGRSFAAATTLRLSPSGVVESPAETVHERMRRLKKERKGRG